MLINSSESLHRGTEVTAVNPVGYVAPPTKSETDCFRCARRFTLPQAVDVDLHVVCEDCLHLMHPDEFAVLEEKRIAVEKQALAARAADTLRR